LPSKDTQHTVIRPVRSGVRFAFTIHFENLAAEELGALWWVLTVTSSGEDSEDEHRLKLGMGKPLGLGAVQVTPTLHLSDRRARYRQLFNANGDRWATGAREDAPAVAARAVTAFETWLLGHTALNPQREARLEDLPRVQMLLALLAWPGPPSHETRYLQIEPENEYRDRKVLPTPRAVLGTATAAPQEAAGDRMTGRVKWFNASKGYGFIDVAGQSKDVFVHISDVETGHPLREGQRVSFVRQEDKRGPKATHVREA
jgi:cold shock CspA family protein